MPPTIFIETQPGQGIRLTVIGQSGSDYGIATSSNLSSWARWTNRVAINGTKSVVDSQTTNSQAKFYRAILLP